MKNFKYWLGRKLRQWLWPNWSYKGEMLNKDMCIVYMFHDADYPEFEKMVMLRDRIDLTNRKTKPTRYLYTDHQMVYDHVLKIRMFQAPKNVELRFSVICRDGIPLNLDEIKELYEFVNEFEWFPLVETMNENLAKWVTQKETGVTPMDNLKKTYENLKKARNSSTTTKHNTALSETKEGARPEAPTGEAEEGGMA